MKKIFAILSASFLLSISSSYAGNPDELDAAEDNNSADTTIVFLRSSFVGGMVKASIYEIKNGETIFVGILKNKTRINHKTTAGKHTYMVVSEAADFMEAEVLSGKTYYSIVAVRTGAWKARFSMYPIRTDGTTKFNTDTKDFKKWMKKTKEAPMTEKALAWFEKHKDSVEKKRTKYWEKWIQKSPEDLAKRTLNPNDGVAGDLPD